MSKIAFIKLNYLYRERWRYLEFLLCLSWPVYLFLGVAITTEVRQPSGVGCPSGTKFFSSSFCFLPKLTLGLNISKIILSESSDFGIPVDAGLFFKSFFYMRMRDPEVRKFWKNNLKSSRPRFNFGAKQKSEFQNFVMEGHPKVGYEEHIITLTKNVISLLSRPPRSMPNADQCRSKP